MKLYKVLKAETYANQQQMFESKKIEPFEVLKDVKRLCKEFGFFPRTLKGSLAEGSQNK